MAEPGRAPSQRTEPHISDQAPLVWRAPEGPEGTGGLRDRPLRAAGSRVAISRAAGPDGAQNTSGAASNKLNREFRLHRRHGGRRRAQEGQAAAPVGGGRAWPRHPWAAAGPGRGTRGRRGLAAVPVGGGRARAGLEIDHSEPSGSRVAISRAGRRPPAHTAARPHKQCKNAARHSKRGRHQPTPCASALTHP